MRASAKADVIGFGGGGGCDVVSPDLSPAAASVTLDVTVLPEGAYTLTLSGVDGTGVRRFQVAR